jgi:hypothetical protein
MGEIIFSVFWGGLVLGALVPVPIYLLIMFAENAHILWTVIYFVVGLVILGFCFWLYILDKNERLHPNPDQEMYRKDCPICLAIYFFVIYIGSIFLVSGTICVYRFFF